MSEARQRLNAGWAGAFALLLLLAWHGGLHAWQVLVVSLGAAALLLRAWPLPKLSLGALTLLSLLLYWQWSSSIQPSQSVDQLLWFFSLYLVSLGLRGAERPDPRWGERLFFLLAVGACLALFVIACQWQPEGADRAWQAPIHKLFPNQNLFSVGILLPAFFIGLSWLFQVQEHFLAWPGLLILGTCFAYLGSRGGLLALAGAGAWWSWRAWRQVGAAPRWLLCVALLLLTLGLCWKAPGSGLERRATVNANAQSADPFRYQRLKFWKASLLASEERPYAGWGQGTYAEAIQRQDVGSELSPRSPIARYRLKLEHAHNEILETAVEWGWPLTLMALLWVARSFWRRGRATESLPLHWALEAFFVGVATHAMVDMPLRPAYMQWALVLAGSWLAPRIEVEEAQGPMRWLLYALLFSACLAPLDAWLQVQQRGQGAPQALTQPSAEETLKTRPYSAEAWLGHALNLERDGKHAQSREALAQALSLEPNFVRAWQWKAKWGNAEEKRQAMQALRRIKTLVVPEDQRDDAIVLSVLRPDPSLEMP